MRPPPPNMADYGGIKGSYVVLLRKNSGWKQKKTGPPEKLFPCFNSIKNLPWLCFLLILVDFISARFSSLEKFPKTVSMGRSWNNRFHKTFELSPIIYKGRPHTARMHPIQTIGCLFMEFEHWWMGMLFASEMKRTPTRGEIAQMYTQARKFYEFLFTLFLEY